MDPQRGRVEKWLKETVAPAKGGREDSLLLQSSNAIFVVDTTSNYGHHGAWGQ